MRKDFFVYPDSIDAELKALKAEPAGRWEQAGREKAVELFRYVADKVPAYQEALKKEGISPDSVESAPDFEKLPLLSKDAYLRAYPYPDLFPERDFSDATTVSATSGSSGEPFYFPRGRMQDAQYEYLVELFLKNQWELDKKKTLALIGFGMGIWIGGIFTYKVLNRIADKGYRLTAVPVGPNIELYLKTFKQLAGQYDQIILMGYPPFIKDVIDEGADYGIDWSKHRLRIMTAAEEFSEQFRAYLAKYAGLANAYADTISIYGTVELGTMANETALANLIRKIAVDRPEVFKKLFPKASRQPTLAQYHPALTYFQQAGDEVVGSGYGSSIPLLRYRFPDMGGVIPFDDMLAKLKDTGIDVLEEAKKAGIAEMVLRLPFVYVYGRADHTIILRGANIYPDEIRHALGQEPASKNVTGKFTMIKKEDEQSNEYLELNIELRKGVRPEPGMAEQLAKDIAAYLAEHNTEYADQYKSAPDMVTPRVMLWAYKSPEYFSGAGKQKWSLKQKKK